MPYPEMLGFTRKISLFLPSEFVFITFVLKLILSYVYSIYPLERRSGNF